MSYQRSSALLIYRKARRGISLIEMLVVMVILAVLGGLILPTLLRMGNRSHVAECTGHQRQIGIALHLYANDHQGKFPPFIQGGEILSSSGDQNTLANQLIPPKNQYLPDKAVFLDPGGLNRVFTRNAAGWADWKARSNNRSGYWHIYMNPRSNHNPDRASEDQWGPNDTVRCAPYKVMMHCYYTTNLELCSHPGGEVNVLRLDGSVELFTRQQYLPGKDVRTNFGHIRKQ